MYLRNRKNINSITKKLKRRRQNGGGIRGITFKEAKRLLTNISPGTALRNMAKSFRSKKVSPGSSELIGSPGSSELIGSPESSGSPGSDLQGSLEDDIAMLMQDYDADLPETLDEIIDLMQKYDTDLTIVIRSLKRAIRNMNRQIKINTKTINDVAKEIEKLERKTEDEVYETTIPYTETTIIIAAVNLQTSNNNLIVLNEALTKFENLHTKVYDKKRQLLKEQNKKNGDNNSEIIAKLKHEWIDIQNTLIKAQEVIKQQKEKIAVNASHQASHRLSASRQASPRLSASRQASPRVSASRQATPRVRANPRVTPRVITSRRVSATGGAQIRRSRKHRISRK